MTRKRKDAFPLLTHTDELVEDLRQLVPKAMKQWGYGEGYQHAHKFEDAITGMECLPPSLAGKRYYQPTDRGAEKRIGERLEEVRKLRERS